MANVQPWQRPKQLGGLFFTVARLATVGALLVAGVSHLPAGPPPAEQGPLRTGNVMEGWRVFARKDCIQCHAIAGLGGQVGPDLARTELQNLTADQLAGALWNHIPAMYSYMLQHGLEYPHLTPEEVSDLFSFLFFARYLDEPGDPVLGERLLRQKGCAQCHATEGGLDVGAPDLKRWSSYANPIVWAQKMWQYAPGMEQAMQRAGITWPQLDDSDLVNIIAYLRSVGGQDTTIYLQPGSAVAGARLFVERKCQGCHYAGGPGKDLGATPLPRSLAGLASRMWNHSPEMSRQMQTQGVERNPLSAQEMADITAYVISLRFEDRGGDPRVGRAVLEAKHCVQCHADTPSAGATAPSLQDLRAAATPARLAHGMWNHGPSMMTQMTERGLNWPVFQGHEMRDLVAYLRSLPGGEPAAAAAPLPAVPQRRLPPIEPGASCVTNACHPGLVAGRAVHAPAAQGECTACHTLVDPQTHEFQLAEHTSDLCYQCHDEPAEMKAHGPVTVGVCTACHDPHSAENLLGPDFTGNEQCFADLVGMTDVLDTLVGGSSRSAWIASTAPEPGSGMSAKAGPAGTMHAKRAMPPALAPSRATGAAAAPANLPGTCITSECHSTLVAQPFVHQPSGQEQCDACHRLVDESAHRFALTTKEPDLCYQCHDRPPAAPFQHGPVAMGMCSVCHNPHSGQHQFMLPETGKALCLTCHEEMAERLQAAKVQHGAIDKSGCLACHDPHRGQQRFQLKRTGVNLCLDCHKPVGQAVRSATVAHEPVTTDKACLNCHNPHASDVPKLLTDVEMDLCLSCHDQPQQTPTGPIIDMKAWLERNPEHHGPIRERNCTACHQPHGSPNFRMLQYAFPREFYSSFALSRYALCFQCHDETLVMDQRTTTLTDFRNGDKNLHFVHVNQSGRTCRACHEIHAGTHPKRIRDSVPYGTWEFPLNFQKTDSGGSCAPACHTERAYDRRQEIIQP